MKLTDAIVELYRKTATDLPRDVERAIIKARKNEKKNSTAFTVLDIILKNIRFARQKSVPICQDTGTPIFYVKKPKDISQKDIEKAIIDATKIATKKVPLRPNAVDILTDKNSGNNVGVGFPVIHFDEWDNDYLEIKLMLKGGGSENVSCIYKLPNKELNAGRDLNGVKKCVINAVQKAQGKGCSPGIVSVCIGGSMEVLELSKKLHFQKIGKRNKNKKLAKIEKELLKKLNSLGIGPMGLGGRSTVLDVKIDYAYRHPASFFVGISYMCWACRRHTLTYKDGVVRYD